MTVPGHWTDRLSEYLDREAAYDEFARRFAESPATVESIT